jgi:hypothetical protein
MDVQEAIGLLSTVLVVAALSVAIKNGDKTAMVFTSFFDGFAKLTQAATLQPTAK